MQATSDVTEGLRRTLQLMQQEVDRSMTSNELLGEKETGQSYGERRLWTS